MPYAEKKVKDEFVKRGKDWDGKIRHSVIDKIQELSKVRGTYYEIRTKRKKIISDLINELISSAQFPRRTEADKPDKERTRAYIVAEGSFVIDKNGGGIVE